MASMFKTMKTDFQLLPAPVDPKIDYAAALYFLDGHYLFRQREQRGWTSKFVTAEDVRAAFTGQEYDSGWFPAGVVRAGTDNGGKWFVYSAPAQRVEILLEGDDAPIKIPLPRTVLLGHDAKYYLWVLGVERFDRNAVACAAPFPNIHDDGHICWGASTPPKPDPEKARQVWELFFSTPFNGHLVDHKSQTEPGDVREQLRALDGKREYPLGDLKTTAASIGGLIDRILKR